MIKQLREKREMTQADLAIKSGVDRTVISRIERGEIKRPSWEIVARLASALNVRPEKLFPVNINTAA